MINIHIIGAGGLAKELISYIIDEKPRRYNILGVWADEEFNNPRYASLYKGNLFEATKQSIPIDNLVLAISKPSVKRKVRNQIDPLNKLNWLTYVHYSAVVSSFADLGEGCVIAPQAIVTSDARLGNFVFMNSGSVVGHDAVLGDYSTLYPNTEVCGDCTLGTDCVLGIGAFTVPGVSLAAGTRVRAGSIVWSSFEETALLSGNPAAIVPEK
jgi:sugar O-acyltransferase (sialic acid O-acetyltransferase NeuD family)